MNHRGFSLFEVLAAIVVLVGVSIGGWYVLKHTPPETAGSQASVLAELTNSGSTNFAGWDLKIYSDGSGSLLCRTGPQPNKSCTTTTYKPDSFPAASLRANLTNTRLSGYRDTCQYSVSFGSTDTLIYHGMRTRGIDCYIQSENNPLAKSLNGILTKIGLQSG